MQKGDVEKTFGNNRITIKELKYTPKYSIKSGISKFVKWYTTYMKKKK